MLREGLGAALVASAAYCWESRASIKGHKGKTMKAQEIYSRVISLK